MVRLPSVSLVCFFVLACAGHESPSSGGDTPARTDPQPQDAGRVQPEREACDGLLLPEDRSLRQTRQVLLHGMATTDITIDLKTGKMTGTSHELVADGDTPIALTVDQQVSPKALAILRHRFESTCAPRRKVESQEYPPPGGSSMMQVEHADGSLLFLTTGGANLPAGVTAADVAREDWSALFDAWPVIEGKVHGSGAPD